MEIELEMHLRSHHLNGRTAYTYGPLVLARDEMKEGRKTDSEFTPTPHSSFERLREEDGELLRLSLTCEGENVLLTDYASCGKHWNNNNARVSVWLNAK